jgi:hypothetical protein
MHPSNALKAAELEGWIKDDTVPAEDIDTTLEERGAQYGQFKEGARIMQELKSLVRIGGGSWTDMTSAQQEALDMICHKIGRLVNGNPNNRDSWHDIAGYATLIVKIIDGENP